MKASVVITTKDRALFLNRAVKSILNSTCPFNDIIIVNDGGSAIYKSDLPASDNLKILNNNVSLGGNKARNQGVLAAEGDVIFFLDDDDAYMPEAISEKLRVFEKNNDVVLVYTGVKFVMSDRLEQVIREKDSISDEKITFKSLLMEGNLIGPTSCVAVRKSAFIAVGMFDENLGAMQDYELWLRMVQHGKVKSDGGKNLVYTIHSSGTQISSKYEKYLTAATLISEKFHNDLEIFHASKAFWSEIYFRVALSSAHISEFLKLRFAAKSFIFRPSLKSLALFIPTLLLRKIKPFV